MVALLSILVVVTFAVVEVEIRGGMPVVDLLTLILLVVLLFEIRVVVGMSVVIPGV